MQGSADYLGQSGAAQGGGVRVLGFKGNSLEMTTTMRAGGARRMMVNFANGFGDCSASVNTAKQVGFEVIHTRSLATGNALEIRSVEVSGVSCEVRDGNVFAQ
jgi:hypothetical protein